MEYKLRAPYSSTAPSGFSTEFSTSVTAPFIQSTKTNLSSSLAVSKNKYVNDVISGNNSKKHLDKLSLSLNFDRRDNFFEGGINYGFIEFSVGELNLRDNITNHSTDQSSTRNAGNSRVANLNINRLQKIDDNYFLSVKFKGQYSADNLDGAEQFSLGGSNGVRAYPNNEGAGAMGYLTTLEIKRLLGNNIEAALFYDYGRTMLYKFLWTGWNDANTAISNNYSLEGYGVSLDWNIIENVKLNFLHARKLGSNQGKDASGNDSDGLSKDRRTLLSLNLSF
jgi:hemolysin activation/secretion protein